MTVTIITEASYAALMTQAAAEITRLRATLAERDAEIAALKADLFDEQMNGEAIRIIREPLNRVGIASAFAIDLGSMAACEIECLRMQRQTILAAFRVNMMRLSPGYSHEAFDQHIAEILAQAPEAA